MEQFTDLKEYILKIIIKNWMCFFMAHTMIYVRKTVVDIYMAKRLDQILIACNVNQWDLYNIKIDY